MKKIIQDKQLLIRRIFLMCYDVLAVFAASIVALLIRFDLNIKSVPFQYMDEVWRALPFMIIVTLIIFWMLRLYSSLWSYAGALEMMYVVSACILDTVVVTVLILLRNWGDMYPVPRSFYILYGLFLFVFVMGCRYSYRGLRVLRNMRRAGVYRRNVLVIGAGDAGNQIIKEINNSRYVKKKVVGVIDDDRNKIGNYIHGAKVVGDRSDILEKSKNCMCMRSSLPCHRPRRNRSRGFLISAKKPDAH